jgi:hypothetical protein
MSEFGHLEPAERLFIARHRLDMASQAMITVLELGFSFKSRVGAMNDEHLPIRALKQKWDEEDAERATQEARAQQLFLEAEANRTFAPIEDFLVRLREVLSGAGASVEIDTTWQHLADRRLRLVATVVSSNPPQRLPLDFTIHGVSIIFHDKVFRFDSGIAALILAITAEVEQFLAPHRKSAGL